MNDDATLDALISAYRAGQPQPRQLKGRIGTDDAYALQVRLLRRLRDAGAAHAGWKIGQTNAAMRIERGEDRLAPGYLLADGAHEHGATATLATPGNWFLEPELAFVLGEDLGGGDVDEAAVARAIATMHPSFELVRVPPAWTDRALQRAVNSNQAGYVLGPALPAVLDHAAVSALQVDVSRDGEQVASVRCGDVIDHPFASVAWLAGYLAALGEPLRAGQVILTGSFTALLPMQPGQSWHARIGTGEVSTRTE